MRMLSMGKMFHLGQLGSCASLGCTLLLPLPSSLTHACKEPMEQHYLPSLACLWQYPIL